MQFDMHEATTFSRLEDCKRVRVIPRTSARAADGRRLSILVAESDPCDALLLEQALLCSGMHVPTHFVADGEEAIVYLRGDPPFDNRWAHPLPTLLLLELRLARTSGFDVLQWLQDQPGLSQVLVVVFSSSREAEDVLRAYALGADSYLIKPSDQAELINVAAHLKNYWLEMSPRE